MKVTHGKPLRLRRWPVLSITKILEENEIEITYVGLLKKLPRILFLGNHLPESDNHRIEMKFPQKFQNSVISSFLYIFSMETKIKMRELPLHFEFSLHMFSTICHLLNFLWSKTEMIKFSECYIGSQDTS